MEASKRELELVAQLAAAPDDLDLRRVYADLLIEREDPRGDFIMLQLQDKLTRSQRARVRVLERDHGKAWLGPLADLFPIREFRGGFLWHVALDGGGDIEAINSPAIAHELASIRSLALDTRTSLANAARLFDRLPRLTHLSTYPDFVELVTRALLQLEIRILYETPVLPDDRIASPRAPTELTFVILDQHLLAAYAAMLFRRVLRDGLPAATIRFTVRSTTTLILTRDPRGAFSQLDVQCVGPARNTLVTTIVDVLDACPDRSFTTVHVGVVVTRHERQRLTGALVRSPGTVLTSE